MAKISIREPLYSDIENISENARQADIDEIKSSSGWSVKQSLRYGLNESHYIKTICVNGYPVSMIGAITSKQYSNCAVIWMISAKTIERFPVSFFKATKICLSEILGIFTCVANYVDHRNTMAIRFINKLGFNLSGECVLAKDGTEFLKFHMVKRYV